MNKYKIHCPHCKKQTIHIVNRINRLRGVKLQCMECAKVKPNYHKLNNLKDNK